jgi:hypothetical protein
MDLFIESQCLEVLNPLAMLPTARVFISSILDFHKEESNALPRKKNKRIHFKYIGYATVRRFVTQQYDIYILVFAPSCA